MADRLEVASDWLNTRQRSHASRTVTYRRGEQSAEDIPATLGATKYEADTGMGVVLKVQQRDYLIAMADLGELGLPEVGDFIDDEGASWEVRPLENQPHYRFSDPYEKMLRIHVVQVVIVS